ncbi:MAG: hypothetical protein AAGF56_07830 [Pseudomonadota bacterium]
MIRALTLSIMLACPAFADPLDLVDYPAIFAANPDNVETVSEDRRILRLDSVTLIHDPTEPRPYIGIDESGQGAVGCLVSVLATIESATAACEVALPDAQVTFLDEFRAMALRYYAENAQPATDIGTARSRYQTYVASQIESARPLCSNVDLMTDLADRLLSDNGAAQVGAILATPRLPVENPCL